jgi:SAM-dependent methyltransferase
MKSESQRITCPVCEKSLEDPVKVYEPSPGLLFSECPGCGVCVRVRPGDVASLYDEEYSESITAGFRSEGTVRHARETLLRIEIATGKKAGNLLDVGCAGGDFLLEARAVGWQVAGVEMQSRSAQLARGRGLEVYSPGMDVVPVDKKFDVITLLDVFEHLPEPGHFLGSLYQRLNPGGVLYIETPNYAGQYRRWKGRQWMAFIPWHEVLYTPEVLEQVAGQAGFQTVRITTTAFRPFSYDGLRRLRWHGPVYNAATFMAGVCRKSGLGKWVENQALANMFLKTEEILNRPFEKRVAERHLRGDQLVGIFGK